MNRKSKALGLALLAALALSALGAQGASGDLFVSEVSTTILTSDEDVEYGLSYSGLEVRCSTTSFSGTQIGSEATEINLTPTFSECSAGGSSAAVRTNHCYYTFSNETSGGHGRIELRCTEPGEHIEYEVPAFGHCNLTVGPQLMGSGASYTDWEGEVTVEITAEVTVTRDTNKNFFCELLSHEGTGAFTGASVLVGFKDQNFYSTEYTEDETATTTERGVTDWSWLEGDQVNIAVGTG